MRLEAIPASYARIVSDRFEVTLDLSKETPIVRPPPIAYLPLSYFSPASMATFMRF